MEILFNSVLVMAGLMFAIPAVAQVATPAPHRAEIASANAAVPAEYLFYHRLVAPQVLMFPRPLEAPPSCADGRWLGHGPDAVPSPTPAGRRGGPGSEPGESR
jgi:hypothetical protein